jgi:signal peptidase II
VRDFIDAYIGEHHWPTFNVADSLLCIGVGLIILTSIIRKHPEKKKAPSL